MSASFPCWQCLASWSQDGCSSACHSAQTWQCLVKKAFLPIIFKGRKLLLQASLSDILSGPVGQDWISYSSLTQYCQRECNHHDWPKPGLRRGLCPECLASMREGLNKVSLSSKEAGRLDFARPLALFGFKLWMIWLTPFPCLVGFRCQDQSMIPEIRTDWAQCPEP